MQELLLDPPLPNHPITALCGKVHVITATDIFAPLSRDDMKARGISPIHGDSKPRWMRDVEQRIVVVKNDALRENVPLAPIIPPLTTRLPQISESM